jgi:hypothetical protein
MANAAAEAVVQQDLSIKPSLREPHILKQLEQKWPSDCVKGLGDINLKEYTWGTSGMKQLGRWLHRSKIVMNGASTYEGALDWQDKQVHERGKARRQQLSKELAKAVNERDGTEVFHFLGFFFLP